MTTTDDVRRDDTYIINAKTSGYSVETPLISNTDFSVARPPSKRIGESSIARLSPKERLSYFAKHERGELVIVVLSLISGIYMLVVSVFQLYMSVFASAYAQDYVANKFSSHDAFEWYIGILMGVVLLCSVGMTMWAQKESKITFGKDTTKMILGFVIGFLSGGRPR